MGLKIFVPWWLKLLAKLILSRLPIPYSFWSKIGVFRHGFMDVPTKAIETFEKYYKLANKNKKIKTNFVSLELGPGNSIISGLISKAYGAKASWLIDEGSYATTNFKLFKETIDLLKNKSIYLPVIKNSVSVNEILKRYNIKYRTNGLKSFKEIKDNTIDFCWSQVVLEHVSYDQFNDLLKELKRVLKSDSISIHSIDFKDHLGGSLNNLRFSEKIWESNFFKNSGFYTNRIRPFQMIKLFQDSGFTVNILDTTRWDKIPVKRKRLSQKFKMCKDDDLLVSEILIELQLLR